jgi:hypothetical protein
MKFPCGIFLLLIAAAAACAQTGAVSTGYFPSSQEFQEIHGVISENAFSDPQPLSGVENGRLISDVGFDSYSSRTYSAGDNGSITIELIRLQDSRAAYSLLTLLRDTEIREGPPGDAYTSKMGGFCFAQGRQWIRMQGRGIPAGLLQRIADSISQRMGTTRHNPPSLISHFPKTGYDPSSLRYFPGIRSFDSYSGTMPGGVKTNGLDMEIAQARYAIGGQKGMLALLSFPTWELAEEYYLEMGNPESAGSTKSKIYARRSGPLLAVLEGTFTADAANNLLSPIKFSYSVRWIADKRAKPTTVWGIPVGILKTVVQSIFFVMFLAGISVLAGAGIALYRLALRKRAPNTPR